MTDHSNDTSPPQSLPHTADDAYETPELVEAGNLRDLLGKSGGQPDMAGPNPTRP